MFTQIICKKNEKIYVSQIANPKKMIVDVNIYKPFVDSFGLKKKSYTKYLCDCKEMRLISNLKTIEISHKYNILKGRPLSNTQCWRLYKTKIM